MITMRPKPKPKPSKQDLLHEIEKWRKQVEYDLQAADRHEEFKTQTKKLIWGTNP